MKSALQDEIKQTRPFRSLQEEAYLNLIRTADVLSRHAADFLKEHGISETQYNVLRILRGAGAEGHACSEVGNRLITRDPDVTRLLDRLEKRGLISRARDQKDRRVVTIRISPEGLDLLARLDKPFGKATDETLGHLSPAKLKQLIKLLVEARTRPL